jgi:23S rRNA (guanine745-N1)-methyltransferase
MLADIVPLLACPVCRSPLSPAGRSLSCPDGHSYDVARQGYVSLRRGGGFGGDTAAMVLAREVFLAAGHFTGLAATLADAAAGLLADSGGDTPDGCVVDVGSGTGYFLAAVLDRLPDRVGVALDASPHALRRAARAHARAGAVGCDVWQQIPLRSGVAGLVMDVLAPRNSAEFRRVARPGAHLLVVTPTRRHLAELVSTLDLLSVDPHKAERLERTLAGDFTLVSRVEHEYRLLLSRQEVVTAVAMGPTSWHADWTSLTGRVGRLPEPVPVTASFAVSTYRANP